MKMVIVVGELKATDAVNECWRYTTDSHSYAEILIWIQPEISFCPQEITSFNKRDIDQQGIYYEWVREVLRPLAHFTQPVTWKGLGLVVTMTCTNVVFTDTTWSDRASYHHHPSHDFSYMQPSLSRGNNAGTPFPISWPMQCVLLPSDVVVEPLWSN